MCCLTCNKGEDHFVYIVEDGIEDNVNLKLDWLHKHGRSRATALSEFYSEACWRYHFILQVWSLKSKSLIIPLHHLTSFILLSMSKSHFNPNEFPAASPFFNFPISFLQSHIHEHVNFSHSVIILSNSNSIRV